MSEAEIERLKAIVEELSDHGCAAERMHLLKAQGTEIERLGKLYRASLELLACQGALLGRAADALERVGPYVEQQLIAELRRAAE